MLASVPFFATFLVLGFNAVVVHCLRLSSNTTAQLSRDIEMHEAAFAKDRCCCKTPSQVTKQYCLNKKYMWLVIPQKGEHCCKVQNAWWCDGVGKDSYKEFDMSICEPHMTCEEKARKFGIPATCARPECGEWCKAECQKVDLVTACERPECKNLKLTYGSGQRKRNAPAFNCDGYKPCCGSQDYIKEHFGGKTAYPSNQACKQQFSSTKCVEWGHQLGMGALDLSCVPLRQQCPGA